MVEALLIEIAKQFGLLGLFIASIAANATIILPVPIDLVVFFLASIDFFELGIAGPLIIGIIVGLGAAIGEMSGYIIGLYGFKGIQKMSKLELRRIEYVGERVGKKGMIFIFLGALTPFPFDIIGIACGIIKYNLQKFFLSALAGKIVRYILIAYAGFYGIGFIRAVFGI